MKKIIEFQKSEGLVPDGLIGINTLNKFKNKLLLSNIQLANFLGQLTHETNGFKSDTESLNYSVNGLINTFGYYRNHRNEAYNDGRIYLIKKANQEVIANKVYWDENRTPSHKLGNKNWGDGWKYRGRGAIQLTGYYNYSRFAIWQGDLDIIDNPDLVASKYYWESAIFFFNSNKLWSKCNDVSINSITSLARAINGGINGLEERIVKTRYYYNLLTR